MTAPAPKRSATPRQLHLLLSATNFAQGLGAFSVIGIVATVAQGTNVPLHEAGLLVSLYAIVYAISSPLLVSGLGSLDRRHVLLAGLSLLTAGAGLATIAPNFSTLLFARALMAIGGGLITPVAAAIGVATSAPAERGRVLATVFAGLALAQALGVPAGAWLGGLLSWRATFGFVFLVSATTLLGALFLAPSNIRVETASLSVLGKVLRQPGSMLAVGFIVLFIGCNFTLLTYLAPFLADRFHLSSAEVAGVLMIYGAAAVVGNTTGGALTDRLGAMRTLVLLCAIMICVLPVLTLTDLSILATMPLLIAWSLFGWSVHVPQQARLAQLDPQRTSVLLSLHSAGIYVGSSLGASLAGQVLKISDPHWLGPAGAVLAAFGLASLGAVAWMQRAPGANLGAQRS
jgi:DHA1 family inner membrane transport protein